MINISGSFTLFTPNLTRYDLTPNKTFYNMNSRLCQSNPIQMFERLADGGAGIFI